MNTKPEFEIITNKFEQDVNAFFFENIEGNLWPYLYSEPQHEKDLVQGAKLYNAMLKNEKNYYLYEDEVNLLRDYGQSLTSIIGKNVTLIELGPGGEKSFRHKTLPLLHLFPDLKGYVGIDICASFLEEIFQIMQIEFPDISVTGIHQDFTQLEDVFTYEKSVLFFKGSTIGNLSTKDAMALMIKLRQLLPKNHYFMIVNDANKNQGSLMKAYNNSENAAIAENVMHRIKRDFNITEMVASAFRYQPEWHAETYEFRHILVATETQRFYFQKKQVEININQKLHIASSFKYPVEFFQKMVSSAGFVPVKFFIDKSNRMAVHLFKAC